MKESFAINNKIFDLSEVNPNIVKYKVAIASADTKANGFYFSKDILTSLIPTIKGCPVSTYYDEKTNSFGGHEGDIYQSSTGLKRTPYIYPVGFCDYNDDGVLWQNLNLDGQDKDWICACVYLWKERYPFVDDLKDKTANQSMEVDINYENKNGTRYVTEASFSGITLIGVRPAFDGSKFMNFSKHNFSEQVNELKSELTNYKKYSLVDFSIPTTLKTKLSENMHNNHQTSVCKEYTNYLTSSNYITPEKVLSLHKYFSRCNNVNKILLGGNDCINWINSLTDSMNKIDRGDKMAEKFAKKADWGSGNYEIKVDKSKDSVSNRAWGDVDKTAQMNKVIKAKNGKSKVHDIYALVEDGYEEAPSQHLKYPIMEVKSDNTAVYNSGALSAALAYANHPTGGNAGVAKKVEGIQKKLGLLKDDKSNSSKEGDKKKMSKSKMNKEQKNEFSKKISMSVQQLIESINNACESLTYDNGHGGTNQKYYISDFDDTYVYGYDGQNQCHMAIPFTIAEDGTLILNVDSIKKANMVSTWVVEDDDNYIDSEDDDTYSLFAKARDKKLNDKLTASQAEIGKKFAEVTSLETALADEKKSNEDRQKEIDNLTAQLKAKESDEKLNAAKALMSKKEFSVFNEDEKKELLKLSSDKTSEEFETIAYAKLGKFAGTNLEFNAQDGKFSYMYVPDKKKPSDKDLEDDVYTKVKKNLKIDN